MSFTSRFDTLLVDVRQAVREKKASRKLNLEQLADEAHTNNWTLTYFLQGRDVSAQSLRRLMTWLDER